MISGYIFTGGESRRMGKPKHEIVLGGRRLAEIAVEALRPACPKGVTFVGKKLKTSDPIRLIPDSMPDGLDPGLTGPLVGLYTALSDAEEDWIAVLACDMPFVTAELFDYLLAIERASYDAVVPVQPDGWPQPLCAIYRREACLAAAESLLEQGATSLQALIKTVNTRLVTFDEINDLSGSNRFFLNLNTPGDLSNAEAEFTIAEAQLRTID